MVQVLLEVVDGTAIKRWLCCSATGQSASTIDVSGDAIVPSPRNTRSTASEIKGKICVVDTQNERNAAEAAVFAKRSEAKALLVVHEPECVVTISQPS